MKATRVDIVTEVVDIPDYQPGSPRIYSKITPPPLAKIGEIPQMVQHEEYHYYPHRVYIHKKGTQYYLVQHSDKDIFEGLITISSDDIWRFRDEIEDEYFEKNKPIRLYAKFVGIGIGIGIVLLLSSNLIAELLNIK